MTDSATGEGPTDTETSHEPSSPPDGHDGAVAAAPAVDADALSLPVDEAPTDEARLPGGDGQALERRDQRRNFVGGLGVMLLAAGGALAPRVWHEVAAAPTADQCEALLARWVSHASRQRDPEVDDSAVADAQERAHTEPAFVSDIHRCETELTAAEVTCGIESTYLDELERCLQ